MTPFPRRTTRPTDDEINLMLFTLDVRAIFRPTEPLHAELLAPVLTDSREYHSVVTHLAYAAGNHPENTNDSRLKMSPRRRWRL